VLNPSQIPFSDSQVWALVAAPLPSGFGEGCGLGRVACGKRVTLHELRYGKDALPNRSRKGGLYNRSPKGDCIDSESLKGMYRGEGARTSGQGSKSAHQSYQASVAQTIHPPQVPYEKRLFKTFALKLR